MKHKRITWLVGSVSVVWVLFLVVFVYCMFTGRIELF